MSNFLKDTHIAHVEGPKFNAVNIAIEKAQLISESAGRTYCKGHGMRIGHSSISPPRCCLLMCYVTGPFTSENHLPYLHSDIGLKVESVSK